LHYAARRGAVSCVRLLLASGASRRLVGMNGDLPSDLTQCPVTKALLLERVGMKRQRSLSSNSLVLVTVLPELAKAFYDAWAAGDVTSSVVGPLKTPGHPVAERLRDAMTTQSDVRVDDMHVCTKSSKVIVEITVNKKIHGQCASSNGANGNGANGKDESCHGGKDETQDSGTVKAMHSLTFNEDGLVTSFCAYTCTALC